ncbi:MAG: hydroxymethylbilane synthase [Sphingomonadales bacterium]|jgi:hydroxymethylbilane synthase|nr:hydroxymethylbilane synthase [Sphingomonadales bacterium]MBK6492294.1 hydroxymethylbilane synthase [Sphingomonadales bacterium]MBK6720835.1 hydroxymethylbilane synthase [Sphingomonadales bacterium]MBK8860519.1 hydroxymethylbilane synthase [Sphingomonadales bacterium]MBK9588648.1 hydroxymethylbilane synthase [Sphingomonadales bacterium]
MANPDRPLRLGTRASPLALAQAHMVRDALIVAHGWSDEAVEIMPTVATGDRIQDRALAEVGGKALWTKELDAALLSGDIDFAVHSMKDVETERSSKLAIAAMLPRADVRDRLVGAASFDALPHGAAFGTSAPRRRAQVLRLRPDLRVILLRGNVQTRLSKLAGGEVDATLLASAGLERLGMHETGTCLPTHLLLPAPAQGAVGIETLSDNARVGSWLAAINHQATFACVMAERALLAGLSGDCRSPVAALAIMDGGKICLNAEIYSADGGQVERGTAEFIVGNAAPYELGIAMMARADSAIRAVFSS